MPQGGNTCLSVLSEQIGLTAERDPANVYTIYFKSLRYQADDRVQVRVDSHTAIHALAHCRYKHYMILQYTSAMHLHYGNLYNIHGSIKDNFFFAHVKEGLIATTYCFHHYSLMIQ